MIINATPPKVPLQRLKHEVFVDASIGIRDRVNWCTETFGEKYSLDNRNGIWSVYWGGIHASSQYCFKFTYEHDMAWFKLRWS